MTAASTFGVTSSRPPAASSRSTSSTVSTVPAPIRQSVGRHLRGGLDRAERIGRIQRDFDRGHAGVDQRADDAFGLVGLMPRRMATSGRFIWGRGCGSCASSFIVRPDRLCRGGEPAADGGVGVDGAIGEGKPVEGAFIKRRSRPEATSVIVAPLAGIRKPAGDLGADQRAGDARLRARGCQVVQQLAGAGGEDQVGGKRRLPKAAWMAAAKALSSAGMSAAPATAWARMLCLVITSNSSPVMKVENR